MKEKDTNKKRARKDDKGRKVGKGGMLGGVGKEVEENAMRLSMVNKSTFTHTCMQKLIIMAEMNVCVVHLACVAEPSGLLSEHRGMGLWLGCDELHTTTGNTHSPPSTT